MSTFKMVDTKAGIVNLESYQMYQIITTHSFMKVQRICISEEIKCKSLLQEANFEWMSLNFRKYRADKLSNSIRRMILQMLKGNY